MHPKRECGSCTLCCKLLPVSETGKLAGVRCEHQRSGKGCAIYSRRPMSCRLWSCSWLTADDVRDLARPDRSHYVIDTFPDFITLSDNLTGELQEVPVAQIWIDPDYPDAHRDPALRDLLERRNINALVRYPGERFAVALLHDGEGWHEMRSENSRPEHSAQEILKVVNRRTEDDE